MADVLTDLQALKREAAEAARRRAKREADIDSMEARLRENLTRLKTEHGVTTVAEGRAKLAELERSLQEDIDRLRTALREEH